MRDGYDPHQNLFGILPYDQQQTIVRITKGDVGLLFVPTLFWELLRQMPKGKHKIVFLEKNNPMEASDGLLNGNNRSRRLLSRIIRKLQFRTFKRLRDIQRWMFLSWTPLTTTCNSINSLSHGFWFNCGLLCKRVNSVAWLTTAWIDARWVGWTICQRNLVCHRSHVWWHCELSTVQERKFSRMTNYHENRRKMGSMDNISTGQRFNFAVSSEISSCGSLMVFSTWHRETG